MHKDHPLTRPLGCLVSLISSLLLSCCGSGAFAQNLVMPPPPPVPSSGSPGAGGQTPPPDAPTRPSPGGSESPAPAPSAYTQGAVAAGTLQDVSLFVVTAPPPKKYAKHDVVEVIINETSVESLTQTTDFKKDYNLAAKLSQFPSLQALFANAALTNGIGAVQPSVGVTQNKETKGTGKLDRKDQLTAKISATVVDVKPNGNLVLEAKESNGRDKEITTMVLSGTCRAEDITKSNTIQSSQLAGLTIRIDHEGDVKESGDKGFIPRILEAVFNF